MSKILKEQLVSTNNNMPCEPIAQFLQKAAKKNKVLENEILNPDKNFENCLKYVETQVKEALGSKSGWMDDEKVYQMAQDYYLSDCGPSEEPEQQVEKEDSMIDGQLCFF
ncbi:MAG: Cas9 inhibitor AcrIIA9 family protein [Eubacteriales bacterium]